MTSRVYVAGVGMIPFVKPGANAPYHVMGAEATKLALSDAGLDYSLIQQAYVGYVYGDSTCGQRALYPVGMTGIPDHQRQQQLLDRLDGAVPGAPGDRIRRGRLRAGARLRADEAGSAGLRCSPTGRARSTSSTRPPTSWSMPPGIPLALRYFGGAGLSHMKKYGTPLDVLCQGSRQGQPSCQEQSAGVVPQGGDRRRRHERSGDLAGRDDPADGLSADLRRRRRGAGFGEVREQARPAQGRPDRRAGHDHRHRFDLRRRRHDAGRRLRHDADCGKQAFTRPPASARKISTWSSCTTASPTTS